MTGAVGRDNVISLRLETAAPLDMGRQLEAVFRDNRDRLEHFLRLRLGSAEAAQDAAQSAFLRLWERRTGLRDENLVSLLFITARNIATDVIRERMRRADNVAAAPFGVEASEVADSAASPLRTAASKQELELVVRIIDELPPKCRRALIAVRINGSSYGQVAQDMRLTESMIRKYVLKGVAYCAARFEQLDCWE